MRVAVLNKTADLQDRYTAKLKLAVFEHALLVLRASRKAA
jgi:hypothetical protein